MSPRLTDPDPGARHPGGWRAEARLVLAVVLAGVSAGVIGLAMAYLLEGFEYLFYGVAAGSLPERVEAAAPWRRVAGPAAAGVMAGCLWWWQRAHGGVLSVEALVRQQERTGQRVPMGLARSVGDAVIQVLTVGGGNSVGREGAPRLAAGAVAARLASWLALPVPTTSLLVAAAAGAGLAAMYNAPLGGAAYAVELVMLAGTRRRGLALALPVSVIATAVTWLDNGAAAAVPMSAALPSAPTLVGCVLAASAAGVLGWLARHPWAWLRDHRVRAGWRLPLAIGGAGALTGLVSVWVSIVPGNGRDALQAAVTVPSSLVGPAGSDAGAPLAATVVALASVVVLKPLLTGLTLGAGATGGLLAPSFSLGGCTGALVGLGLGACGVTVSVPALAVAGAATALAVTQRAPVFAALFVWEIVHGPAWTLPVVLLACLAAVRLTGGAPRG